MTGVTRQRNIGPVAHAAKLGRSTGSTIQKRGLPILLGHDCSCYHSFLELRFASSSDLSASLAFTWVGYLIPSQLPSACMHQHQHPTTIPRTNSGPAGPVSSRHAPAPSNATQRNAPAPSKATQRTSLLSPDPGPTQDLRRQPYSSPSPTHGKITRDYARPMSSSSPLLTPHSESARKSSTKPKGKGDMKNQGQRDAGRVFLLSCLYHDAVRVSCDLCHLLHRRWCLFACPFAGLTTRLHLQSRLGSDRPVQPRLHHACFVARCLGRCVATLLIQYLYSRPPPLVS